MELVLSTAEEYQKRKRIADDAERCDGKHKHPFRSQRSSRNRLSTADFEPESHTARDLLNKLAYRFFVPVTTAEDVYRSARQHRFLEYLRGDEFGDWYTLQERFQLYFEFLDHYFFFGVLQNYVELKWDLINPGELVYYGYAEGTSSEDSLIVIYLSFFPHPDECQWYNTKEKEQEMIGTLLHEMAHAYLMIYSCRGQQCSRNFLNTLGITGHGPIWHCIAHTIQQHIRGWHSSLRDLDVVGELTLDEYINQSRREERQALETWDEVVGQTSLFPRRRRGDPRWIFNFDWYGNPTVRNAQTGELISLGDDADESEDDEECDIIVPASKRRKYH